MSGVVDVLRRVVQEETAARRSTALAVVTATHPHTDADDDNNYEVDARLKHEDLELTRVPVAVGQPGHATSPSVGDLVLVQFVDGDLNQPLVTGCLYTDDVRPPLFQDGELLFEQRVSDGTLNQLRFAQDGSIYLQRDVKSPQDNSSAQATISITSSGDVQVCNSDSTATIKLGSDGTIELTASNHEIKVSCQKLSVDGDVAVSGDLTVSSPAASTKISGNEITGTGA